MKRGKNCHRLRISSTTITTIITEGTSWGNGLKLGKIVTITTCTLRIGTKLCYCLSFWLQKSIWSATKWMNDIRSLDCQGVGSSRLLVVLDLFGGIVDKEDLPAGGCGVVHRVLIGLRRRLGSPRAARHRRSRGVALPPHCDRIITSPRPQHALLLSRPHWH